MVKLILERFEVAIAVVVTKFEVPYLCSPEAERAEGWTRSNHLMESLLHLHSFEPFPVGREV